MERVPYLAATFAILSAILMPELTFLPKPSKRLPPIFPGARAAAAEIGLDQNLFEAVVWAEGGRLADRARGRARGPAQITRSAASDECPDLAWDAVRVQDQANLRCGARIWKRRPRRYLGRHPDPMLAASLYNTKRKHWARIAESRKVPPFRETVAYVTRISRYYCQHTGRRLLIPAKHLAREMIPLSERVDRGMDGEFALENEASRPGCSPYRPP